MTDAAKRLEAIDGLIEWQIQRLAELHQRRSTVAKELAPAVVEAVKEPKTVRSHAERAQAWWELRRQMARLLAEAGPLWPREVVARLDIPRHKLGWTVAGCDWFEKVKGRYTLTKEGEHHAVLDVPQATERPGEDPPAASLEAEG